MVKIKKSNRNNYIDELRGIAAIGIVAIHTAFWSGSYYTPLWFQSLTLLLDVPFFFFLSGWASSHHVGNIYQTIRGLGRIWLKWVFFIIVWAGVCIPIGGGITNIREFASTVIFNVTFQTFPVAAGSMWFMPYYMIVLVLNQFLLFLTGRLAENKDRALLSYTGFLFLLIVLQNLGSRFVLVIDASLLFYSFFWSAGVAYERLETKITRKGLIAGMCLIVVGIILSARILDMPVSPMQDNKFPPNLTYLLASFIVILIALFMKKDHRKQVSLLVHIGRNAIWYFFAQGVGSSLLYPVLNYINIEWWPPKWLVCFLINLLITTVIAELLRVVYGVIQTMCEKLQKKLKWERGMAYEVKDQ
ncbi:acyltransferase [Lachnospiraceae bacterium JLR.KK008]